METPRHDFLSSVDTSRPFRSVKEAIAIFGERILVGEIYSSSSSPKPHNNHVNVYNITPIQETTLKLQNDSNDNPVSDCNNVSPKQETTPKFQNDNDDVVDTLKRVEAELEETKAELRLLREREQETQVALASLNAELHKNMSRLAAAEAATAAAAASGGGGTSGSRNIVERDQEERWRRELKKRMEKNTTLAHILSLGLGEKDMMTKKKKPIVPLVGDLFSRKKGFTNRTISKYS